MIEAKNNDIEDIIKDEGADSDLETKEDIHAGMEIDHVPHLHRA